MKYKSDGKDKWDSYMVPRDQFLNFDYYISKEKHNFHCDDLSFYKRSDILNKDIGVYTSINMKDYKISGSGILIDRSSRRVGKN